ncbi:MAG: hypothetical protein JO076_01735 [Verrucomicrobia bacterium]|nr:hypothetical protein [Verrucomicrobiota bacterium]
MGAHLGLNPEKWGVPEISPEQGATPIAFPMPEQIRQTSGLAENGAVSDSQEMDLPWPA